MTRVRHCGQRTKVHRPRNEGIANPKPVSPIQEKVCCLTPSFANDGRADNMRPPIISNAAAVPMIRCWPVHRRNVMLCLSTFLWNRSTSTQFEPDPYRVLGHAPADAYVAATA